MIELELNVVMMPSEALPGTSSGVVAVLCIRSVAVQRHVAGSLRYRRSSIAGRGNGCIMQNSARFEAPETMIAARRRKSQPGQALVETGLAIALFTVVVLGMIEFGYAFMALNVITQAATAGARAAGALQVGGRGTCGRITDTSSVDGNPNGLVRQQIGPTATVTQVSVRQYPDPNVLCSGACCSFTGSTIPTVTVTVTADLPHLFGLLGSGSFSFTRAVTFRDEGR